MLGQYNIKHVTHICEISDKVHIPQIFLRVVRRKRSIEICHKLLTFTAVKNKQRKIIHFKNKKQLEWLKTYLDRYSWSV